MQQRQRVVSRFGFISVLRGLISSNCYLIPIFAEVWYEIQYRSSGSRANRCGHESGEYSPYGEKSTTEDDVNGDYRTWTRQNMRIVTALRHVAALLSIMCFFLTSTSFAGEHELIQGRGTAVCDYVVKEFDKGSLRRTFLKQRFVKNGLFRIDTNEIVAPSAGVNALLVEQVQGTMFNVYIETAPSSLSQEVLEFLSTVEFIEYKKDLFVLANITPKKLDSHSVVYGVQAASFIPVCRFR